MPFNNQQAYPFTQQGVAANAPSRSGVYGIFKPKVWIYIGEAGDIRARLWEHVTGQSDQSACILGNGATGFTYELVDAYFRLDRETTLRGECGGICNGQ